MADTKVLSNQKTILSNQTTIVKNQKAILANQSAIARNQKTILANRLRMNEQACFCIMMNLLLLLRD